MGNVPNAIAGLLKKWKKKKKIPRSDDVDMELLSILVNTKTQGEINSRVIDELFLAIKIIANNQLIIMDKLGFKLNKGNAPKLH